MWSVVVMGSLGRASIVVLMALFANGVFSYERIDARDIDLSSFNVNPTSGFAPLSKASRLKTALGITGAETQLDMDDESISRSGGLHSKYIQTLNGIPIFGARVILHEYLDGKVAASGEYFLTEESVTSGDLGLNQAVEIARNSNGHNDSWQIRRLQSSYVYFPSQNGVLIESILVTYVANKAASTSNFPEPQTPEVSRPYLIISRETGQILKQWDSLAQVKEGTGPGGNAKTGEYFYGGDQPFLDISRISDTLCSLSTSRVRTVDLGGVVPSEDFVPRDSEAFRFECPENTYQEINGAFSPLNDAHFFGTVTFDMFDEWLLTPPLNNQALLFVHYGQRFENAFWDGDASYFGDGADNFYPFTTLNVVAHEIAHGFTEQNSGLIYSEQSGGINESFSDITGETAEFFLRGSVDWLVGSDLSKGETALRYFEDPTQDGDSIGHAEDFIEGMDVHYSSGVFNRAFYLLANTSGWDVRKAFEVFATANRFYWTPNETFDSAACGVVESSIDLSYNYLQVGAAFLSTGVQCGYEPVADFVDVDLDGMDDFWEEFYELDPGDDSDGASDKDDDGLSNFQEYQLGTNPSVEDTDQDGITDSEELNIGTDPILADTDSDGLTDGEEIDDDIGTNPLRPDTDEDKLDDGFEVRVSETDPKDTDSDDDRLNDFDEVTEHLTDPNSADTDEDGLNDFVEVNEQPTNPLQFDTDADGLSDGAELIEHSTDPILYDTDEDQLSDGEEVLIYGTNPNNTDSDNDLLDDYRELQSVGTDPNLDDTDRDGVIDGLEVDEYQTNPFEPDTDIDRLSDFDEIYVYSTDPNDTDTDDDGLSDSLELFRYNTDPTIADMDNDGLSDGVEILTHFTDPQNEDSDGDGLSDNDEVSVHSSDPNSSDSDDDGLNDSDEINTFNTSPVSADSDQDGLNDEDEVLTYLTNPNLSDSDADELSDFIEIFESNTDPNAADTDGDLVIDGYELVTNLNPLSKEDVLLDHDGDGVITVDEYLFGSIFNSSNSIPQNMTAFSFETGFPAFLSAGIGSNEDWSIISTDSGTPGSYVLRSPEIESVGTAVLSMTENFTNEFILFSFKTEFHSSESTFRVLVDGVESMVVNASGDWVRAAIRVGTGQHTIQFVMDQTPGPDLSPSYLYLDQISFQWTDQDQDLISDRWEQVFGFSPFDASDGDSDFDLDGLTQRQEFLSLTSPLESDTDGDLLSDAIEIGAGSSPINIDTDGDSVDDGQDAFPLQLQISLDGDLDGVPDEWNIGCDDVCQSASGITLDISLDDTDNDGLGNNLDIDNSSDNLGPVIEAPTPYLVSASGLLNSLTIPTPTAFDLVDGEVLVSTEDSFVLPIGRNLVTWTASDSAGNQSVVTQEVLIQPYISFESNAQIVEEGDEVVIRVVLAGDAVSYPVVVPYEISMSSTADGEDHNATSGVIVFDSEERGLNREIRFNVFDGDGTTNESNETVVFDLVVEGSSGSIENTHFISEQQHTVTIVKPNSPPAINLTVSQGTRNGLTVGSSGEILVQSNLVDFDEQDTHRFEWYLNGVRLDQFEFSESILISPQNLEQGTNELVLSVSDGNDHDETSSQRIELVKSNTSNSGSGSSGGGSFNVVFLFFLSWLCMVRFRRSRGLLS